MVIYDDYDHDMSIIMIISYSRRLCQTQNHVSLMHRRKQLFFSKNSLSFKLPICWFEFHWLDTCKSQETDLNKLSDLSPLVRWNEKTRVARVFKEVSGIETRRVELSFQRAAGSLNAFSWLLFFPKWRGFSVASLLFFSSGHANISAPLGLWVGDGVFALKISSKGLSDSWSNMCKYRFDQKFLKKLVPSHGTRYSFDNRSNRLYYPEFVGRILKIFLKKLPPWVFVWYGPLPATVTTRIIDMFSRGFLLTFTFHCYKEGAISKVFVLERICSRFAAVFFFWSAPLDLFGWFTLILPKPRVTFPTRNIKIL